MVLEQRLKEISPQVKAIHSFRISLLYDFSIRTLFLTWRDIYVALWLPSEAMLTLRMISTTTSRKERREEPKLETSVSR